MTTGLASSMRLASSVQSTKDDVIHKVHQFSSEQHLASTVTVAKPTPTFRSKSAKNS